VRRSSTVLAIATLVIWAGRIRNAASGDEGAGPVVLALTFVGLAVAVLATRTRNRAVEAALAGWTGAVWLVRAVDIAVLSDHDAAFVAVHLVLAAVSLALAAWVGRDLAVPGRRATAPAR
jgi:hypothetical protein